MKGMKTLIAVGLGTALLASAATAGGLLCMLQGRNVTVGTVKAAPENGIVQVSADGTRELKLGPETKVVRMELVPAAEIRPGEVFVSLNGKSGGASPAVAVFKSHEALAVLYRAMGHGTNRPATVAKTATKAVNAARK